MSPSRSPCARRWRCADATRPRGGFKAVVIRLHLPDGRMYGKTGELNFVNNTIAQNTDTITLRGTIPNPPLAGSIRRPGHDPRAHRQ